MNTSPDLTRWNRGGLRRFQYIDGNAVTFLEDLRLELAEEFTEWRTIKGESPPEQIDCRDREKFLEQAHQKMVERYHRQTQDFAWEMMRGLARASHVLTEHLNAFANEGYIGTATQWESLRRLAAMLDYHPHPPASASTPLVLLAKEGASGTVKKGLLQVKHTPPDGGAPVTFETLEDIEVDAALNAIRLQGWDRAVGTFYDLDVRPPGPPIGERDSLDIQGVGTTYFGLLPAKTIAALADLDPGTVAADISPIRLWEFKTKAQLVMAFQPGLDKYTALKGMALAQILRTTTPELVNLTREPSESIEELKNRLRVIQISLDETVFGEVLLADFRENGGPAEETGPVTQPTLPWALPEDLKVSSGEYALVVGGDVDWQAAVVSVAGIEEETRALHIADLPGQPDWRNFQRADARLWINPDSTLIPWLKGAKVVQFKDPHGLSEDNAESKRDVVAWHPEEGEWALAEVMASDNHAIELSSIPPPMETQIYKVLRIGKPSGGKIKFPHKALFERIRKKDDAGIFLKLGSSENVPEGWEYISGFDLNSDEPTHYEIKQQYMHSIDAVYLLPEVLPEPVGKVAESGLTVGGFSFGGKPGKLKAGQWVVGETGAGLEALRVTRVQEEEGRFILGLVTSADREPAVLKGIHGPLEDSIPPVGYKYNGSPVTTQSLALNLKGEWPVLLKRGREIVIEQINRDDEDEFQNGVKATITNSDPATGTIDIAPPLLPDDGFTVGNTVIRGNVVTAGHGERRSEKILGSGDGSMLDQAFVLKVDDVSFVADATQPTGVRADLDVIVDGKIWKQVPTLNDSRPEDSHYVIRMTEDGHVRIQFGDGLHARRLPTGPNNVRVRYRTGTGLGGNLPAESFQKPARPHRLIEGLRQSIDCAGGNDMEGVESLRDNAASGLLTLERAVSLADFAALATSQSSVWQAKAFARPFSNPGVTGVEVVVVPAGGGKLEDGLKSSIEDFLREHAIPTVGVTVKRFTSVLPKLSVDLQINSAEFIPDEVKDRVRAALLARFALENRKLSQSFYRSEVYQVVEAVQGVENSIATLNGDSDLQVLRAKDGAVIYFVLDDDPALKVPRAEDGTVFYFGENEPQLDVTWQEFEL